VVSGAGGLHKFIRHNSPIMTDSGGFQVTLEDCTTWLVSHSPALLQVMSMASRDQFIYSHQLPKEGEEDEDLARFGRVAIFLSI
jgi:hypothetical protein